MACGQIKTNGGVSGEVREGGAMSAGENYPYPERLEVFFTASADWGHALRELSPICEADPEAGTV